MTVELQKKQGEWGWWVRFCVVDGPNANARAIQAVIDTASRKGDTPARAVADGEILVTYTPPEES